MAIYAKSAPFVPRQFLFSNRNRRKNNITQKTDNRKTKNQVKQLEVRKLMQDLTFKFLNKAGMRRFYV